MRGNSDDRGGAITAAMDGYTMLPGLPGGPTQEAANAYYALTEADEPPQLGGWIWLACEKKSAAGPQAKIMRTSLTATTCERGS